MANNELTLSEDEFIVSKTDLKGDITYGNSLFIKILGYDEEELLDQPHNILRHAICLRLFSHYCETGLEWVRRFLHTLKIKRNKEITTGFLPM